jgi:hypothetical protein
MINKPRVERRMVERERGYLDAVSISKHLVHPGLHDEPATCACGYYEVGARSGKENWFPLSSMPKNLKAGSRNSMQINICIQLKKETLSRKQKKRNSRQRTMRQNPQELLILSLEMQYAVLPSQRNLLVPVGPCGQRRLKQTHVGVQLGHQRQLMLRHILPAPQKD